MQELEKILKEVEAALKTMYLDVANNYDISDLHFDRDKRACVASRCRHVARELIKEIFRKHMNDGNDGWIPVEERLPENEEMMLVTCKTKSGRQSVNRAWYGEGFWHGTGSMSGVIAWRPLPEPYCPEKGVYDNDELR